MTLLTDIVADGPQGKEQFSVDLGFPHQADVHTPRLKVETIPQGNKGKFIVLVPRDANTGGQLNEVLVIHGQPPQTGNPGKLICSSDGSGIRIEHYSHEGMIGEPHLQGREWTGIWIDDQLGPPPDLQGALGVQVDRLYTGL